MPAITQPERPDLSSLFAECNRELIAAAPEVRRTLYNMASDMAAQTAIDTGIVNFFSVWNLIREEMDSLDRKFKSARITLQTSLRTQVRCSLVVMDLMCEDAGNMGMNDFAVIFSTYYTKIAGFYVAEAGFVISPKPDDVPTEIAE